MAKARAPRKKKATAEAVAVESTTTAVTEVMAPEPIQPSEERTPLEEAKPLGVNAESNERSFAELVRPNGEGINASEGDRGSRQNSQGAGSTSFAPIPDPYRPISISLGPTNDSPIMTLFRSNRLGEMAIKFDVAPEAQYRTQLRQNGWDWQQFEKVWTLQFNPENSLRAHLAAERLFHAIGNSIREDAGLPAVSGMWVRS
jgi:hypothetical protein